MHRPRALGRAIVSAAVAGVIAGVGGSSISSEASSAQTLPGLLAHAGCSAAAASAAKLSAATAFVHMPGDPYGIAVTPDGRWAFVDLQAPVVGAAKGRVSLMSVTGGHLPRVAHSIRLPFLPVGDALTPNGQYLLIADDRTGAAVVSVARAEKGAPGALLGMLGEPHGVINAGAVEPLVSPDGNFAFVSLEGPGQIAVYDLAKAIADHFHGSSYVGSIHLGPEADGMAISPNGRWLYATSYLSGGGRFPRLKGKLSVIDLVKAEHDPAHAVISTVPAHCSPVRVAVSPNGATVWVTARESDQVLAYSATKLISDPAHALIAAVRVGEAPVGLVLVDHGALIVVGDSNRFDLKGHHAALTVLNSAAVLSHRPAIIGTLRASLFPRDMALEPDGKTLLVGNFVSGELETVSVNHLP